ASRARAPPPREWSSTTASCESIDSSRLFQDFQRAARTPSRRPLLSRRHCWYSKRSDVTLAQSAHKQHRDGTHRLVSPETTLARVRPLRPVMGITRIANITGLDCIGIPVTMVCRPNARSLAVSQGKGLDLTAAKVSGVMESIEGYHAEHITLPLK